MLEYHAQLIETHPFESRWWSWPIIRTPIWYYSGTDLPAGLSASVVSFGNPLIWWTGVPCLLAACVMAFVKKDRMMAIVFTAFIFQFAPWIFISRATFIYHFFSAVPFLILSIVYVIRTLTESGTVSRKVAAVYLSSAAILFAVYYPILSGLPVAKDYSDALRLFSTWHW